MVYIDGNTMTIEDVIRVTREFEHVSIAPSAFDSIKKSRDCVEQIVADNRIVYGITTGVGEFANQHISPEDTAQLQLNLIRSHSVNVGEPMAEDIVRGIILLRANTLAKGYSGVRLEIIELLCEMLNKRIHPFIPAKGSVGASGDLSPLSHLALVMIGEGECLVNGKRADSLDIFNAHNMKPITLQAKEGLALINGTQVMASIGCHVLHEARILLKSAQIAGAMSLEALKGTAKAFDEKVHAVRPHQGQIRCARNIRRLIAGSEIIASHKNCDKVQDAYTLRCTPQVYGPIMDIIEHVRNVLTIEINSATDNPLIFHETGEVISGGNFHGEPLAFALDYLGMGLSEIGNISERTLDRLVNPHVSGLPPFLTEHKGLHSGFMIVQYTAAALVSENKVLAHPACVDSIPTSAGQEDHVSMGSISARHAWAILKNVQQVISIELMAAAQGMDFHHLSGGVGTSVAHRFIRKYITHVEQDRVLYKDIEKMCHLVEHGVIVQEVEQVVGVLD